MSLPAAAIAPVSGEMKPILMGPWAAAPPGASSAVAVSRSRIFGGRMSGLVPVRDRKLLGGEERDDQGAARRHNDFLLDPRGGDAVGGGAVGLDGEHHARLELHRVVEGVEPADDRPLVQAQADPVAEVQAEGRHLAVEADLLRLREGTGDLVGGYTRLDERDPLVHSRARLLVGGDLRPRGPAHAEGAVVAGAVAD